MINEFDLLSAVISTAIKHGKHNQKSHGNRGGHEQAALHFDSSAEQVSSESSVDESSVSFQSGYQSGIAQGMSEADARELGRRAAAAFASDPLVGKDYSEELESYSEHDRNKANETIVGNMDGNTSGLFTNGIQEYQGIEHKPINKILRNDDQELSERFKERRLRIINSINTLLQNSRLSENMTLHRGFGLPRDSPLMGLLRKPGSVITEPGFMSTSASRAEARRFGPDKTRRPGVAPVMLRIVAPAGTPAVYLPKELPNSKPSLLQEREMLLAPSTNMIVRKSRHVVDSMTGKRVLVVDVEVLP